MGFCVSNEEREAEIASAQAREREEAAEREREHQAREREAMKVQVTRLVSQAVEKVFEGHDDSGSNAFDDFFKVIIKQMESTNTAYLLGSCRSPQEFQRKLQAILMKNDKERRAVAQTEFAKVYSSFDADGATHCCVTLMPCATHDELRCELMWLCCRQRGAERAGEPRARQIDRRANNSRSIGP